MCELLMLFINNETFLNQTNTSKDKELYQEQGYVLKFSPVQLQYKFLMRVRRESMKFSKRKLTTGAIANLYIEKGIDRYPNYKLG